MNWVSTFSVFHSRQTKQWWTLEDKNSQEAEAADEILMRIKFINDSFTNKRKVNESLRDAGPSYGAKRISINGNSRRGSRLIWFRIQTIFDVL